jgi:hypothetical protein
VHPSIKTYLKRVSIAFHLPENYSVMAIALLRKFDRKKFARLLDMLSALYRSWDLIEVA